MEPQGINRISKPGRRSRVPLSCEACRSRKLKCNREHPCQNCIARGEQSGCKYKGSTNGPSPTLHHDKHADQMRQRIDHLEGLVKRLIAQNHDSPPETIGRQEGLHAEPVPANTLDSARIAGTTIVDGNHSLYKSTEDWYDVLQEVNELKNVWAEAQYEQADDLPHPLSNTVDGTSLLFSQVQRVDVIEILSSLPPKPEVDKLMQRFFDRENFPISIPPILHEPTFMREYAEHWKDPSRSSVIWIGLLFSILGITMLAFQFGEPPEYEGISEPRFHLYRLRTAQCLLIGDIAKCRPYTVETLRFNATAELNRKDDNSRGLWIMTGVIVRAAVNMGYHRDPSYSPSMSILQAEYRRRVWLSVISMDNVSSFWSGLPRMIPAIDSDTLEPRNLHEWELVANTTVLPPSRPLSEHTPATYLIAKGRIFRGLGNVIDFINNTHEAPYSEVLKIDQFLYNTYWDLPSHMRLDASTVERSSFRYPTDFSNLQLICMYHHGVCTLHRKYIPRDKLDPPWNISRLRCITSALALIDYQRVLDLSWYTFSRSRQMLARAAMILLLELESRRRGPDTKTELTTDSLLQAFEKSVALWAEAKGSCDEARRVHQILANLLSSFKKPFSHPDLLNDSLPPGINTIDFLDGNDIDWASWDDFVEGL